MTSFPVRFLAAAGLAMVPALSESQPELKIAPPGSITEQKSLDYLGLTKSSLKLDHDPCEYLKTLREFRISSKEYPVLDPGKVNRILSPLEEKCDYDLPKPENNNKGMCLKRSDQLSDEIMGCINHDMEAKTPQLSDLERILDSMNEIGNLSNHVEDVFEVLNSMEGAVKEEPSSQDLLAVLESLNTPPLSCEDGEVKSEKEDTCETKPSKICSDLDLQLRHQELIKRQEQLAKRFRNVVVQESGKHVSSELSLFMNYTKSNFKLKEIREKILRSSHQSTSVADPVSRNAGDGVKKHRYFGAGVCRAQAEQKVEVKLNEKIGRNIRDVSEKWLWNLKSLKTTEDPYATDSSSGGESDNDDAYFQDKSEKLEVDGVCRDSSTRTLYERSVWRWTRERAAIASRWTWLQNQVVDLDGRIRQYDKLEKKIRAEKQEVRLKSSSTDDIECGSSRTRSLVNSGKSFQRRKLVQSSLKKGPKCAQCLGPSRKGGDVNCGCLLENSACFLCGGENKRAKNVDKSSTARERIAEIDTAFHPVLSSTNEIPLSTHIDSLIQTGEWRTLQRSKPIELPTAVVRPVEPETGPHRVDGALEPAKWDKRRPLMRNGSLPQYPADKGFKSHSYSESNESDYRESPLPGSTGRHIHPYDPSKHKKRLFDDSDQERDDSTASPAPSSSSMEACSVTRPRERNLYNEALKRRTTYDFDQILIPYSVAAATRVQILQYKEIQTPSWREVPMKPDPKLSPAELDENMSESEYKERHDRSEVLERLRFYSKPGQAGQLQEKDLAKKSRRTDSFSSDRLDSEEIPFSPRPITNGDLQDRRRNSSCSQPRSAGESMSSFDFEEDLIPTFPTRKFPLSDTAYQAMLREMEMDTGGEGTRRKRPKLTAGQITDEWNTNDESDDDKWLG